MDRRIERDENEFSRTLSFFDATFALSMTLLVTTIDPGNAQWSSWSALWDSVGFQLMAFAISFALVASYWWRNHRFVASLETLSPGLIGLNVVMLGFVALIPFTTDALGNSGSTPEEIATVLYAADLVIASALATGLYVVARRDRLFRHAPTAAEAWLTYADQSVATVVFLVSIPIALLVSGEVARWSWVSLAVLGPLVGRWTARARGRAEAGERTGAPGDT